MSYKITDNTKQFEEQTTQKASLFLRLMAEAIVLISTPNTPMKSGDLRNRVLKQVLGLKGKISWDTNYAIYQEEKQFKNYSTPGTGPHFAENAVNDGLARTGRVAREAGLV